jgi:hypothetical protein
MVDIQSVFAELVRRVNNWSEERSEVFASLPDNPWTYPGCGVHVKASDFFSEGNNLRA